MKDLLVGIGHDPKVVALVRSLAYLVLPLLIDAALVYLASTSDPRLLAIAPLASLILRNIEGLLDQRTKPSQNATYPSPPAGAGVGPPRHDGGHGRAAP